MSNLLRILFGAAILCLLPLSPTALCRDSNDGVRPQKSTTPQLAKALANILTTRGYVEVPLLLNKVGWLDVNVEVERLPMLMMLDTGASNINLDWTSAKRAKLTIKEVEEKTSALGGTLTTGDTKIGKLSVAGLTSPAESCVVDFSSINSVRKERGAPPFDGVLGGSFLAGWSAVVDCGHLKLYLLDDDRRARNLTKLLKRFGYVEVPLALNKASMLDVKVQVDSMPMLFLLDTGYNETVTLDRRSAKEAKLAIKEIAATNAQLGGHLAAGQTKIGRLTVGSLASSSDAQVMDFSIPNAGRTKCGAPPFDGCLGGEFLKRYSAVIDYAGKKLYLLPPVEK
jgi:predicted aspartyl protease